MPPHSSIQPQALGDVDNSPEEAIADTDTTVIPEPGRDSDDRGKAFDSGDATQISSVHDTRDSHAEYGVNETQKGPDEVLEWAREIYKEFCESARHEDDADLNAESEKIYTDAIVSLHAKSGEKPSILTDQQWSDTLVSAASGICEEVKDLSTVGGHGNIEITPTVGSIKHPREIPDWSPHDPIAFTADGESTSPTNPTHLRVIVESEKEICPCYVALTPEIDEDYKPMFDRIAFETAKSSAQSTIRTDSPH